MKKFITIVLLIVTCCFLFACQKETVVRLSFGPENPLEKDANELTGDRFYQEEQYQKAISSYERAVKAYEEAFGAGCEQSLEQNGKIIKCYVMLKEYEKAKEKCNELKNVIVNSETSSMMVVYNSYVIIAYGQADYETAIYYLELILEEYAELDRLNSYPKIEIHYLLADANKEIENYEEALKHYQKQLDLELYYHSVTKSMMSGVLPSGSEQLSFLKAGICTYIDIGDLYGLMEDKENSLRYLYYAYDAAVEYQEREEMKPLLEENVIPELMNYYLEDKGSAEGFESWLASLGKEYKQN